MHIELPALNLTVDRPITLREADGATIRVLDGQLWLTEEDRLEDRFLAPGEAYRVAGLGRVVIDSASGARVVIESPVSVDSAQPATTRLAHAWQGLVHRFEVARRAACTPAFVK